MVIELSTDLIFLGIVICYALTGAKKGGVMSIGGLIAVILSWILSKMLALPLTAYVFVQTNLEPKISGIMSVFQSGIIQNTNSFVFPNTGINMLNNFWSISDKLTGMVSGIVNQSVLNVCSMFTSIVLFALFMFIFGIILKFLQKILEQVPMGKIANFLLGLICGSLKGVVIAAIIYMALYALNTIFGANIPLNDTYVGQLLEIVNRIHF